MPKKTDRKKLLIYAGVAGAVLALVVLMKRKAAGGEEGAGTSLPTYTSGPSSIPGAEGGNSGELASFENSLSAQLPQAIESGVRAGLVGNQQPNSLAETLAAVGGLVTSLRTSYTGEQVSGSLPSPSAPAPTPEPAPHPVSTAPPPPKPAPPPAYKTITCGNGCPGHKYPDGHSECQTKKGGKCSW